MPYLIGNIIIKYLDISFNKDITDKSIPFLKEIIEKSNIDDIDTNRTSITSQNILPILLSGNKLKNGLDKIFIDGK